MFFFTFQGKKLLKLNITQFCKVNKISVFCNKNGHFCNSKLSFFAMNFAMKPYIGAKLSQALADSFRSGFM